MRHFAQFSDTVPKPAGLPKHSRLYLLPTSVIAFYIIEVILFI